MMISPIMVEEAGSHSLKSRRFHPVLMQTIGRLVGT
jgi:hypothetical protein